jgi:predicted nucleotidyltransferase
MHAFWLMRRMKAREGDFIETRDRLVFDVKGLLHPPDRVVAYIRYYPDNRGTRSRDRVRYVKVYDLTERRLLLEKRWSRYLYYDEMQGRELQGVPRADIRTLHTPKQRLVGLLHSKRKDPLEASATMLVKTLAKKARLPYGCFGVSGSLLVGLHRTDSDLDIIVYGLAAAKRVERALSTLLEEDQVFHKYRRRDLRSLYLRRGLREAITLRDFLLQERRKVLQGKFESHDYFIRCVKNWREIGERYGDVRYTPTGKCAVSAKVTNDQERLMTPCRYLLEGVKTLEGNSSHRPHEVVSFRGRFAEQASRGERVFARGRLERARSDGSEYYRLVVGEGPTDVLRTIW